MLFEIQSACLACVQGCRLHVHSSGMLRMPGMQGMPGTLFEIQSACLACVQGCRLHVERSGNSQNSARFPGGFFPDSFLPGREMGGNRGWWDREKTWGDIDRSILGKRKMAAASDRPTFKSGAHLQNDCQVILEIISINYKSSHARLFLQNTNLNVEK